MASLAPIVQQLSTKIKDTAGWDAKFRNAVKVVNESGVAEMKDIQTLEDYLQLISDLLKWIPREGAEGRDVYNKLCQFYIVMDAPDVKTLQDPIRPEWSYRQDSWLTKWLKSYAVEMGKFLDTPESLTPETLETFRDSPNYNLKEYIVPRGGWRTFNDFFARSFKPGYRPIAAITDPTVIVSPADSTYGGQWEVRSDSGVTIKNMHWRIAELFHDSPYQNSFNGGIFMHAFLGPEDYHRQHAPVGGKVLEARVVPGDVYLEVNIVDGPPQEDGASKKLVAARSMDGAMRQFDAPDTAGYQFAQARGLVVLETAIGLVAVLPMGMGQVSSVILTAEVGMTLRKGEEISYFQFGGSDIVLVFEAKSNVSLTAQLGTHYKVGTRIANAYPVE